MCPAQGVDAVCYLCWSRFQGAQMLPGALPTRLSTAEESAVWPPAHAPRTRRSFARLNKVLEVPNLIDIQRKSFAWLTDPNGGGLRETIDDISPIEDYTGNLAVDFGQFVFD